VMPALKVLPKQNAYMCQSFALPEVDDAHVIEIIPEIQSHDGLPELAHHMLVHICEPGDFWQKYLQYGECSSPVGNLGSGCYGMLYGWAVGMRNFSFPPEAGFRIGTQPAHGVRHIIIELHYNNPKLISGLVDNSGISLRYTPHLRKYDAGVITLGDPFVRLPSLPAQQTRVERETNCPSECTSQWPHDINVIGSFMHMHLTGKQLWTNHWRGSQHLGQTNRVDFYVYEFQQVTYLNRTILRGDRLNTHCTYNTMDRTATTRFGINTEDEMCMEFITYYPIMLAPTPYAYCGYSSARTTYCGPLMNSSSKNLPNPTIVDPPGTGNITFGQRSNVCELTDH